MMNIFKKNKYLYFAFLAFSIFPTSLSFAEMGSIRGDKVMLREDPNRNSKGLWQLNNGFPVQIVKRKGDWIFIKDFENDTGWVSKSQINKNPQVIVKANKNEEQSINIRQHPNMAGAIVGNAFYGVVFSVIEKKSGWVNVQHETGLKGWVKADFLWGM